MSSSAPGTGALARLVDALARACAYVAGLVLTAMALMSVYSIVGRAVTGKPIQGDFELVQLGCAICVGLFLPICQLRGGNIIVDFFTARAAPRTRAWLDAAGALIIALMMVLLLWRTWAGMVSVKGSGDSSMIMGVPIWWGYAGMLPGMAVTVLAALLTARQALARREAAA